MPTRLRAKDKIVKPKTLSSEPSNPEKRNEIERKKPYKTPALIMVLLFFMKNPINNPTNPQNGKLYQPIKKTRALRNPAKVPITIAKEYACFDFIFVQI